MKAYFVILFLISTLLIGASQWSRSLSIGSNQLDGSSILDINSTTKGTRPYPSMTELQRDAISSPASGLGVYNTDTNSLNVFDGTSWVEVGSGGSGSGTGSKNYSGNYNFEKDLSNVSSSNVALTYSLATISGELIEETKSLKLSKDAADRNGEYWQIAGITIDPVFRGDTFSGSISVRSDYSTYVNETVEIRAYDGSTRLPLITENSKITVNALGVIEFSIHTVSTTSQVDLRLYVIDSTATAYDFSIDLLSYGPSSKVLTSIQSDWQKYTPTFQGFGTVSASEMWWKRIGDSISIKGSFVSGITTATEAQIGLPTGLTIDSVKVPSVMIVGDTAKSVTTSNQWVLIGTGGDTYLNVGEENTGNTGNPINANGILSSGQTLFVTSVPIPIQNWSSGALLSTTELLNKTHGSSNYMSAGSVSVANATETVIALDGLNYNFGDIADVVNDKIIVKKSGRYIVSAQTLYQTSGAGRLMTIIRSSVTANKRRGVGSGNGSQVAVPVVAILNLAVSEELELVVYQDSGGAINVLSNSGQDTFIDIAEYHDYSTFGIYGNHGYVEKTLASDFTASSPSVNVWQQPNSAFSIVLEPGTYDLNLQGMFGVLTATSIAGDQITTDIALATNSTAGTDQIITFTGHHSSFAANNFTYSYYSLDKKEYVVSTKTTIYVHFRYRAFSGSPTITTLGLRSDAGSGNGTNPILSARRVR